ncbi:MAG: Gfo/Idh/MocA family oxidoreductase [Desulfarculaceae bacterium]
MSITAHVETKPAWAQPGRPPMVQMQPAVEVAVIGAGYWGKNLVRNFHQLEALVAVVDSDPAIQKSMAENYPDVQIFDDPDRVLSDSNIRAVAIATPAETHSALVARALAKGKHVFVEKPLCLDVAEGKELVRRAESQDLILMVGHLLHYHPAVARLKGLVDDGRLGKLQYIYSNRLNLGKFRNEENILWSFAPHDVSLILALTDEMPETVTSFGGNYLQTGVADVTVSTLSFASGVKAHIYVSWLHPFKEQKLVVVGTEGMAVFDDTRPEKKLLFYPKTVRWHKRMPVPEKTEPRAVEYDTSEPLKSECAHFLEAVHTGLKPTTDGQEGLYVLQVLDACQQSLNMGGGVVRPGLSELGILQERGYTVHPTAVVDEGCSIGQGTKIWHFAHIIKGSRVGENCNLGQNVVVGPNVTIGNQVKIQNNVSVYEGVTLEDHVFCGPSMVFTNVYNPRSAISRKHELRSTLVREGASLGANCTIVCGNTVGRHAFVAAGSVVIRDVPDYAMVAGNPAQIKGWMCSCGVRLDFDQQQAKCEACGREYVQEGKRVRPA